MQLTLRRFQVGKRHPLTISRGTSTGSENLRVDISAEGVTGIGEMAPTSGGTVAETAVGAEAAFQRWQPLLADLSPWQMQEIETRFDNAQDLRTDRAARAALDMALHDWQGKRLGVPVWKLFGLHLNCIPLTSITIGINPPDVVRERVRDVLARTGARALKVKLGSPDGIDADKAIFLAAQSAAREAEDHGHPAVKWRVDANGGWSVATAQEMMHWLAVRRVEFVEQPLLRGREAELPEVYRDRPLPIYADESVCLAADIPLLAGCIDGVNLKLMKCGGLREALRIVHTARAHGLRVMYGCMSETSLAITAAAHLSSLADALDLDSHLNLLPDPFVGAALIDGRIVPNDRPGLGVVERTES